MIGISESYEQFVEAVSEAVPTLEHIETIDDFIETVNEIQGYEQIVSIGELITDLQETSESFSDVVNVEDLQEVIENHTELESLGEILAVTSLAGLVDETLDAAESTVQEIVEEITNINGFAEVESIDDFIQELSQSP